MSEETTQLTPITESEETTKLTPITEKEKNDARMSTLPTRPNSNGLYGETKMTPSELKERMDALALLAIDKINAIIDGMQAGGDVAKIISFKNDEEGVECSLEKLFSMIFEPEGLSNILVTSITKSQLATETQTETDGYITLNGALENLFTFSESFEWYEKSINENLKQIKDNNKAISGYRDSIKTYQNDIEGYKTNIEAYKTEINKTLEQIKTEINNAFDELKNYADSLVA